MQFFIKRIQVNQILHLNGFTINLGDSQRHLLITRQNGSGKTQLIKAIAEHLQLVCQDPSGHRLGFDKNAEHWSSYLKNASDEPSQNLARQQLSSLELQKNNILVKFESSLTMSLQ